MVIATVGNKLDVTGLVRRGEVDIRAGEITLVETVCECHKSQTLAGVPSDAEVLRLNTT